MMRREVAPMVAPSEETAHDLIMRALDGDRSALLDIVGRLGEETGRDGVEVLIEMLEG